VREGRDVWASRRSRAERFGSADSTASGEGEGEDSMGSRRLRVHVSCVGPIGEQVCVNIPSELDGRRPLTGTNEPSNR
jgi:hypothetical protein